VDKNERAIATIFEILETMVQGERDYYDLTAAGHATHGERCKTERKMLGDMIDDQCQQVRAAVDAWKAGA